MAQAVRSRLLKVEAGVHFEDIPSRICSRTNVEM